MFGKVFEQMYTGSMVGAGLNVYSLWPYMIACCDSDGDVDVHPVAVAAILGAKVDDIKGALDYLLSPDEHSRSEEHDGARIVKVLENRYHLVNYEKYRKIKDQDERREQLREAQRRFRAKKGLPPVISNHDVIGGNPASSAVIKRKPRAESRENRSIQSINPACEDVFNAWYLAYPRKVGKVKAAEAWGKMSEIDRKAAAVAVATFAATWAVRPASDLQFCPHPTSWLNQRRWEDEIPKSGLTSAISDDENARRAAAARGMV